jgi:hypothetical protein
MTHQCGKINMEMQELPTAIRIFVHKNNSLEL